jgi:hypothetical protein
MCTVHSAGWVACAAGVCVPLCVAHGCWGEAAVQDVSHCATAETSGHKVAAGALLYVDLLHSVLSRCFRRQSRHRILSFTFWLVVGIHRIRVALGSKRNDNRRARVTFRVDYTGNPDQMCAGGDIHGVDNRHGIGYWKGRIMWRCRCYSSHAAVVPVGCC